MWRKVSWIFFSMERKFIVAILCSVYIFSCVGVMICFNVLIWKVRNWPHNQSTCVQHTHINNLSFFLKSPLCPDWLIDRHPATTTMLQLICLLERLILYSIFFSSQIRRPWIQWPPSPHLVLRGTFYPPKIIDYEIILCLLFIDKSADKIGLISTNLFSCGSRYQHFIIITTLFWL